MLFSRAWLQEYIEEELPEAEVLAEKLGLHSFEVEGVNQTSDDHIIDIDILPNRAHDAMSYLGMAREISAVFSLTLRMPDMSFETVDFSSSEEISLDIENPDLVPRAMKKVVRGVKVSESPEWLKGRLEAMGQKSINNIVDITNFVMYELGQPVHAFDIDKLAKGANGIANIHIRGAKEGETLKMLDGKEFTLEEGMLVIADSENALDIAGIKGGVSSGISDETKNIMISVCNFEASNIRSTSKALGLRTDASSRFERDIAPELAEIALHRICHLIDKLVEGEEISKDFLDAYPRPLNQYILGTTKESVAQVLGVEIKDEEIEGIFKRLGFTYKKILPLDNILLTAKDFIGKPYLYGASIRRDAPSSFDCSSFISYLYHRSGLYLPTTSIDQYIYNTPVSKDDLRAGDLIFSNSGEGNIWYETQEYMKGTSFDKGIDHVGMYLGDGEVIHSSRYKDGVVVEKLEDSEQFKNIVAYSRAPGLSAERYVIEVPFYRLDLRIEEDLIEEIGRMYGYQNITEEEPYSGHGPVNIHKEFYWVNKIKDILVQNGFSEVYNYSFVEKGERELENALASDKGFLRRGLGDGLAKSLTLANAHAPALGIKKAKVFEMGTVFDKEGEHLELYVSEDVSKLLSDALGVEVSEGSMNVTKLLEQLPEATNYDDLEKIDFGENKFNPISPYPFMTRDIALWVPSELSDAEGVIGEIIEIHGGGLMIRKDIFDVFEKDGRVSYGFRLVFQSTDRTLTDDEVNIIMDKITAILNDQDGWEVR